MRRPGDSFIIIAQNKARAMRQKRFQRDSPWIGMESTSLE
jgi:hypothetical protein